MMISYVKVVFSSCFLVIVASVISVDATDTIRITTPLRNNETLVSSGGTFTLGFYNPGNSNHRYVGVWYTKVSSTPAWVANGGTPLFDSSGIFQITNKSTLEILNSTGHVIWSTISAKSTLMSPIAQLLDTGNLVIRDEDDENPENFIWKSFDHPTNVHLAGMKLGLDLETGMEWNLTSMRTSDDLAPGSYTHRLDPRGYPELVVLKGTTIQYRYGPWNGLRFSGIPRMQPDNNIYNYSFVLNQKEIYYIYNLISNVISERILSPYGSMQRVIWDDLSQNWRLYLTGQSDTCDNYATCGAFGVCNVNNSPICGCVDGFVPKITSKWNVGIFSDGCVRRTPLSCSRTGDGFWKISNVKLPETRRSWYNTTMSLKDCKQLCLKNCSCTAYSSLDVRGEGSGCLLWFSGLIDIKVFDNNGQDLFVRLASSEIRRLQSTNMKSKRKWVILGCGLLAASLVLGLGLVVLRRRKRKRVENQEDRQLADIDQRESDLPLLNFAVIAQATNNFSFTNKIGEGGFGVVYKGTLPGGQDVAVKKLVKESSQSLNEFKNEVICIAKLQHRNLVKLIGCAFQADERLLVYDYVPNKGLDTLIFDQARNKSLDWPKRFNIINGVARGLLYLHQDSTQRIIHRDLKASNVLLDHDYNPKISDFGTARCLYGSESLAKTRRVVGTYGYMSPEYAIDGIFSVKSDVFSFGVLVLEIISGLRNRGFLHKDHDLNLLGHAWRLFLEGEAMKLMSTPVNNGNDIPQIVRSIHVGLLCVQRRPEDRPTMSSVVVMLSSDGEFPQPKQPGFFTERNSEDTRNSESSNNGSASVNDATTITTLSLLSGR